MQFYDPPRRQPPESFVPMINVVFLLLIFFLMTAQIAPPEPFEVTPPEVTDEGVEAAGEFTLYLGPDGALAYGDSSGEEAALAALKVAKEAYCVAGGCSATVPPPPLILRADTAVTGTRLARLMPRLCQRRSKIRPLGRSKSRPVWRERLGACGPHIANPIQGALAVRPIL